MSTSAETWFDRYPLFASWLFAGALLGVVQGTVLGIDNGSMPGLGLLFLKGGIFFGFLTMLVMLPVVVLLRRLQARRETRQASWSSALVIGLVLAVWMLAQRGGLPWWGILGVVLLGAAFAGWWPVPPRLRRYAVAALAVVVFCLWPMSGAPSAPGAGTPPEEAIERGRARPEAPDVVLVTVDTLRADRVGLYATGESSLTPQIDRFGSEGTVFKRALSSSPWTIPSMASLFTGLPTLRHGAGLPLGAGFTFLRTPLKGEHTTLAEHFKAAGYQTRAAVANGFLTEGLGMAQGFDVYQNLWQNMSLVAFFYEMPLTRLIAQHPKVREWGDFRARRVTDQSLAWLAESGNEPIFLWAHYIDPHMPFQADPDNYDPQSLTIGNMMATPEPLEDGTVVGEDFFAVDKVRSGMLWLTPEDRQRIGTYYDDAVSYVDEHVGRLLEDLRGRRGGERPLIVFFTADHGEELWDHGGFEHGHDYYREITRVPMMVWGDGIPALEVESLVGLVDVTPTLLELAGIVPPQAGETGVEEIAVDEGRSLVPLWKTPETAVPRIRFAEGNLYNLPAVMLEEGPWRFILRANGQKELYDAHSDPEERANRAHEQIDLVERFTALLQPRLDKFLEGSTGEAAELSPEELRALRSLGYVQ